MFGTFPHGYALLVGVGASAYQPWSLPTTVKDARALRTALTDPNLCAYPNDDGHIRLLYDGGATRAAILDGLAWLATQATSDPQATAVVYYSGHGWLDRATGGYYLVPHDVAPFDIAGSALAAADFTAKLRDIRARRLLAIMDCCHAEGMASAKEGQAGAGLPPGFAPAALPKDLVDTLKQGEGRAVFTSSRGEQRSWIRPDGTLSIYTAHLLEALQGAGNQPGDTTVRISNLMNHLGKAVPASARALVQAEQTPFFDQAAEDFAVALLRGGKGLPAGGWEPAASGHAAQPPRVVTASGERGVAIGRDAQGSTIITGDRNVVRPGKPNDSDE
jgi:hypothetical protein